MNKRLICNNTIYFYQTIMAIDVLMGMRVFTKVVELKSFAKVSDRLELSRGMTSRYVAQVEEHLGVRLINRTTRHLSLTEAGHAYYQKAVQILALVAETEQSATYDATQPRGTLRITSSVAFGGNLLGEAISAFLKENTQVKADVFLCERIVDLVDEGFDVAIRISRNIAPGLIARPFAQIKFVACASPEYLEKYGMPSEPLELTHHNCLFLADSGLSNQWYFEKDGVASSLKVQGSFQGNNGNILCSAAVSGLGIIYQPYFLVREQINSGQLIRLFPDWQTQELKSYIVYTQRKYLLPKIRSFIDFMVQYFEYHPDLATTF